MLLAGLTKWINFWTRNGWKNEKGHPVRNPEIFQYISGYLHLRGMNKQKVLLEYVGANKGIDAAHICAINGMASPAVDDWDWAALLRELEKCDGSKQPGVIAHPATSSRSLPPAPTISPHLTGKDKSKESSVIVATDTNANTRGKMKCSYKVVFNPDVKVEGIHWEGSEVVVTLSSMNGNPLPLEVTQAVNPSPSSSQPIGSSVSPDELNFSALSII
jgi:hypothetical protein